MKAKTLLTCALLGAFIMMTGPCTVFAQGQGAAVTVTFSEQELDQMLAPVALYPDSLLAQILIAATYPDQVMDADHWLKAHPGLRGGELSAELDRMGWDLSIKALVPFPQVLDMMAQEPDWTQRLGEAFLAQQTSVMDSVQRLRRRAQAAGNLRTSVQQRVVERTDYVEIEPVNPEVVYVPRYNPAVVYGTWWWPAYPPFAYYPVWPGPVLVAPVFGVFGFWGAITVGPAWGWGWGYWGWGSHAVFLNVNRGFNINTRNAAVINRMQNNFRIAGAHNMAMAGRIGSGAARTRAFGTSAGNPAALRGHITSARVSNGRVVSRAGASSRSGASARGAARTSAGSRSGFGGQGSRGGRPSASDVMNQLRGGGRGGAGGRGYGGRTGGAASRGAYHGASRGASRGAYHGASRGGFGGASRGAARGGSRGGFGGAARGGSRGGFGGAARGASRGGGHNAKRK